MVATVEYCQSKQAIDRIGVEMIMGFLIPQVKPRQFNQMFRIQSFNSN